MTSQISSKRAFTLIELLTVIAIIGIILAMGVPAVTSLTKATALQSGTRTVASTLSLARQHAITQRTATRVVFVNKDTPGASPDMPYRAYSVVASNRNVSGPLAWEYISKWEYLPVGAVFRSGTVAGGLDNTANIDSDSTLPFPSTGGGAATLSYIEFKPSGAGTKAGGASLTVGEGIYMSAGLTSIVTSANTNSISVDNLVGRIKVTRP